MGRRRDSSDSTVADVVEAFRAHGFDVVVGKRQVLPKPVKTSWTPINPDEKTRIALGDFHIAVHHDLDAAREELSMSAESSGEVQWRYSIPERGSRGAWSTISEYGNVGVSWYPSAKKLDERWHRLDAILSTLVAPG